MTRTHLLAGFAVALAITSGLALAGIISEGKHTGTIIYDRWDGCIQYDGTFLNYISESVKEEVRKYAGQRVTLDVTKCDQPINPGDALFSKFASVEPWKGNDQQEQFRKTLRVETKLASKDGENPLLQVDLINAGTQVLKVPYLECAPTLLMKNRQNDRGFLPADGPSIAALTRISAVVGDMNPDPQRPYRRLDGAVLFRWEGTMNAVTTAMRVRSDPRLRQELAIAPGERLPVLIEFDLGEGEYDFLCGVERYDLPAVVSTLTAFDVDKDGNARAVTVKRK